MPKKPPDVFDLLKDFNSTSTKQTPPPGETVTAEQIVKEIRRQIALVTPPPRSLLAGENPPRFDPGDVAIVTYATTNGKTMKQFTDPGALVDFVRDLQENGVVVSDEILVIKQRDLAITWPPPFRPIRRTHEEGTCRSKTTKSSSETESSG